MSQIKENIFILLYHSIFLFPLGLKLVVAKLFVLKPFALILSDLKSIKPIGAKQIKTASVKRIQLALTMMHSISPKDKLGIINV